MNGANPYVITFLLLHRTIGQCSLVHVRLLITKPLVCYKETPSFTNKLLDLSRLVFVLPLSHLYSPCLYSHS